LDDIVCSGPPPLLAVNPHCCVIRYEVVLNFQQCIAIQYLFKLSHSSSCSWPICISQNSQFKWYKSCSFPNDTVSWATSHSFWAID